MGRNCDMITDDDRVELGAIAGLCHGLEYVGSRITCDPPVTNTDKDILCLTLDHPRVIQEASTLGYVQAGSVPCDRFDIEKSKSQFLSFRKNTINLIVTDQGQFFDKFMAATSVAKKLNLLKKEDRIHLFQAVLYANPWI